MVACLAVHGRIGTLRGPGVYVVKLTRERGPRGRRLDDDNLRAGMKAVRDGVADALGVDDGSDRVRWEYDDVPASAWGVLVHVRVEAPAR